MKRPGAALTRRCMLAAAASAAVLPGWRAAQAEDGLDAFPKHVTLIVAGPAGSRLDSVSKALLPGLQMHLPPDTLIGRDTVGGLDGVTGANQFATDMQADGAAALLVPGAAPLAWLVGDSRVHFDPSRWLPVLAGVGPAMVVGRINLALRPGVRVRVAAGSAISPALSAMLAIDLLGATVVPVYGLDDEQAALAALTAGRVDAVLIRSVTNLNALSTLAPGAGPIFSGGLPDSDGGYHRDTIAPVTPTFIEYAVAQGRSAPAGPRFDAWRCAAAAAQLRYALVLPSLTPPSAVALWRDAGTHAFSENLAASNDVVYSSAASGLTRSLNPSAAALLDLRGWLATHLGWQPS